MFWQGPKYGYVLVRPFEMRYRDLVPFVQFKKPEKHPWKSITFSEVVQMAPNRATHHI